MHDANVKDRCFSTFGQGACINERVGFIRIHPIVVDGDVKVPIFGCAISAQPIGQFVTFTVFVELFKLHLNFHVVVLTRVRRSLDGKGVSGKMEGLIDRSRH